MLAVAEEDILTTSTAVSRHHSSRSSTQNINSKEEEAESVLSLLDHSSPAGDNNTIAILDLLAEQMC